MKILIAPGSFKNSLSAKEVAGHIAKGILQKIPDAEIHSIPMSDGGEGMVQAIVKAASGKIIQAVVHDPLMRKITSFFGVIENDETAVIEMAVASGIELLTKNEYNPLITTTYGTGELMNKALDLGCKKIIIGIGGSATNDGGMGMAKALGVKFTDYHGCEIGQGGGSLSHLSKIDIAGMNLRLKNCQVIVAADVSNPLTGPNGASRVYAPQKGASPMDVEKLETNLRHFASIIKTQLNIDIETTEGYGAAGGLGAGLRVFANATIENGFQIVSQYVRLEDKIKEVDLVITGEGKIDFQTKFGKAPSGVASLAKKYHKPVIAFTGILDESYKDFNNQEFSKIIPLCNDAKKVNYCMKNAAKLLEKAATKLASFISDPRSNWVF